MEPINREKDIRKRLFQNSALMGLSRIAVIIAAIVCVPFIIESVSLEGYGIWETAIAFSGLTTILTGTLSSTLLWRISNTAESRGTDETHRLMRIGIFFSLLLILALVPPVWFFRHELTVLLKIPPKFAELAAWVLPGMVAISLLGGINESMAALLNGCQRSGAASLIQMASTLMQYAIILLGLFLGWGFFSLIAGFACSTLFLGIGYFWKILRFGGRPSLMPVVPTKADYRTMAGYAALLAVGYLSSLLREQTDKLLLAAVGSSMALVAYYGIAARMANLMIQFYAFFGTPMISAVGALYASGDWQGVKRLFSNMSKIVPFFAGILVVLILGFYDRLIAIWLGRTIPEVLPLLAMLLISNFILVVLTGPGSALCRGIGKVGIETKFILVYLTMNFAMTVGLVLAFGAIGTVIASAASMAVSAFFFVWFLYGTLDLDRSGIRLSLLSFPIVFLCVFAAWQISAIFPLPPSRVLGVIHAALMSLPVMLIYVLLMTAAGIVPHKKILNFGLAAWRR